MEQSPGRLAEHLYTAPPCKNQNENDVDGDIDIDTDDKYETPSLNVGFVFYY